MNEEERIAGEIASWLRDQGYLANNHGATVVASLPPVLDEASGLSIMHRGMFIEPDEAGWLLVRYLQNGKQRKTQLFETAQAAAVYLHELLGLSESAWAQSRWSGKEV